MRTVYVVTKGEFPEEYQVLAIYASLDNAKRGLMDYRKRDIAIEGSDEWSIYDHADGRSHHLTEDRYYQIDEYELHE